ncbi:hypothetical protein [Cellulomonas phragmiteti]|uniref:Lipoprotein n=1 Tax=Cellulomonas phragmiteti TaxID=478780 RepID=A0ABQ4DLP4_9CELL|nr:hypothetical protein [Cellulomonas phragmiteti]GIG40279.1 hypothetical protein Cph01nite_20410 [Cellulomonas phragmiteti]
MRIRRRLAAAPFLLLALAACSDDAATTPDADADAPEDNLSLPPITGEGRGSTELPALEDQTGALEASGGGPAALAATIAAGATEAGQVAEAAAGSYTLRVACTSSDGAPLTITVSAAGSDLTQYQAPCTPVFQGGTTMADSDPFQVPGGPLELGVVAASDSAVAVGLVPAG